MKRATKILIISFLLLTYVNMLILYSFNLDQYFMIAGGNDILNGYLTYNTHLHINYVQQQWLYSLIFALVDNIFGNIGILVFTAIQDAILWYLSFIFLKKKLKSNFWSTIIPIIFMILNFFYIINNRPQTITLICLLGEILILEKYKETKNWKFLFSLIPVLILLANVHQSVYLYCGIIAMPYMLEGKKLDWKVIFSGILMLPISLCTPYGINGALYIFKAIINGQKLIKIAEMQPLSSNIELFIYICIAIITVVILNYFKKSNKFINFYMLLTIFMTILTIRSIMIIYIPLLFIARQINFSILSNIKVFKESLITTIILSIFTVFFVYNAPKLIYMPINLEIDLINHYNELNISKTANIYNVPDCGSLLEYYDYNTFLDTRPDAYDYINMQRFNIYNMIDAGVDENGYSSDEDILKEAAKFEYLITYNNSKISKIYKNMKHEPLYTNNKYSIYKSILPL